MSVAVALRRSLMALPAVVGNAAGARRRRGSGGAAGWCHMLALAGCSQKSEHHDHAPNPSHSGTGLAPGIPRRQRAARHRAVSG